MASVSKDWNSATLKQLKRLKQQGTMMLQDQKIMDRFYRAIWDNDIKIIEEMEELPGIMMLRFRVMELVRDLVTDLATGSIPYHEDLRKRIKKICLMIPFSYIRPDNYIVRRDYLPLISDFLMGVIAGIYPPFRLSDIRSVVDCLIDIIWRHHAMQHRRELFPDLDAKTSAKIYRNILSYSKGHRDMGALSSASVRLRDRLRREWSRRKLDHALNKPVDPVVDDAFIDFFASLKMSAPAPQAQPQQQPQPTGRHRDPWDSDASQQQQQE